MLPLSALIKIKFGLLVRNWLERLVSSYSFKIVLFLGEFPEM